MKVYTGWNGMALKKDMVIEVPQATAERWQKNRIAEIVKEKPAPAEPVAKEPTKKELQEQAKEAGVKGYTKMSKEELEEALAATPELEESDEGDPGPDEESL